MTGSGLSVCLAGWLLIVLSVWLVPVFLCGWLPGSIFLAGWLLIVLSFYLSAWLAPNSPVSISPPGWLAPNSLSFYLSAWLAGSGLFSLSRCVSGYERVHVTVGQTERLPSCPFLCLSVPICLSVSSSHVRLSASPSINVFVCLPAQTLRNKDSRGKRTKQTETTAGRKKNER